MIVINPSDILEYPKFNIVNDNAYGEVVSTLSTVYQKTETSSVLKIDIFNSPNEIDNLTKDIMNENNEVVAKIFDLSTKTIIRGTKGGEVVTGKTNAINKTAEINANHTEYIEKKIRIEINKSFANIQKIDFDIAGSKTSQNIEYDFGYKASTIQSYKDLISDRQNIIREGTSLVDEMISIKSPEIESDETETRSVGVITTKPIYEDDDTIYVELLLTLNWCDGKVAKETIWRWDRDNDDIRFSLFSYENVLRIKRSIDTALSISFKGATVVDYQDKTKSVYSYIKNQKQFSLPNSELLQNDAIVKDEITSTEMSLFDSISENVINVYRYGLQTVEFQCKIIEYANENGEIVINPAIGEMFDIGDVIYIKVDSNGKPIPASQYANGAVRLFEISHSEIVYDNGRKYYLIKAKEKIAYKLSIEDNPEVKVYRNGVEVQNGSTIYIGDTLTISKASNGYDIYINSTLYDFVSSAEINVSSDIDVSIQPKEYTLYFYPFENSSNVYTQKTVRYNEPIGELPTFPDTNFLYWEVQYSNPLDKPISYPVVYWLQLTPETKYAFAKDMRAYAVKESSGGGTVTT